ncbi:MAG: hypothetical protein H6733_16575 [Alphaproteobacteria bacterium]|nr:hypothetical protein [Alphaproteobacteria bacterium]
MVLNGWRRGVLRGLGCVALAALAAGGCAKKGQLVRVAQPIEVATAWVVDLDGKGAPVAAPASLVAAGDGVLQARNLVADPMDAATWGTSFERRRATPHRLSWITEHDDGEALVLLVELRPYYDNVTQGRYRWRVAAVVSVMPASAPERTLSEHFEIPVFLLYQYQGADDAMKAAQGEILRRLGKLVDTALQDPDGSWQLDLDALPADAGASAAPRERSGTAKAMSTDGPKTLPEVAPVPPAQVGRGPLYFVLVDRFANGDRSNDGDIDPSDPQAFHGGDLRGVLDHLDHIQALGFRAIWLSPLTTMQRTKAGETGGFHGYWMEDPATLDPHLGSQADLVALRDGLARRGMGMVLDVVTNHVAYDSPLRAEHPSWFHHRGAVIDWTDLTMVEEGDVHGLPDLDQDEPAVYAWLKEAVIGWEMVARPAGLRLDAVRHVPERFWRRFNADVAGPQGPDFLVIGELFNGNPTQVARTWAAGGFRQMFDFPLHYAMVDVFCRGGDPRALPAMLGLDRIYPDASGLVTFLDNHDLPRIRSACPTEAAVLDALTFQYGVRGIPAVTYGTEAGLTGTGEPDNRADMVFVDDTPTARRLTALARARADHPALRSTTSVVLRADDEGVAVLRLTGRDAVVVTVSDGPGPLTVPLRGVVPTLPALRAATDLVSGAAVPFGRGVAGGPPTSLVVPGGVHLVGLTPDAGGDFEAAVAAAGEGATEVVRFEATAASGVSALTVVGAAPELGAWSPARGLALQARGGAWVGEVTVPAGSVLAFKLVGRSSDGAEVWEDGPNRYAFEAKGTGTVAVTWNEHG